MNLRPLGDRVIIKLVEVEEKTAGGILLPDKAKERPTEADIVAVGTGRILNDGQKVPIDVKVGDRIVINKYAGTEFKVDDTEYLIIREDDILAVKE
ncbi:co-chaperone GroES [Candidatus Contubernalis alkaliaceticus]|uniref:co-chaperone GroES n=1 Tax=Candidatus Contubernalis alkaliaceticus TaxID=338645 RepID=UPI001F4BDE4D|nr:co-chaperone GroES [Candidatus Contubernalis alkalaceticus]UNC91504.1 co-chaperone GroES [Candidatus Contubernalis alkalaceticus]